MLTSFFLFYSMVTVLFIFLCLPIIFASSTFASVSHINPDCLTPFTVYLIFAFVTATCVCSLITLLITSLQIFDYYYVRFVYRRHHPHYQNPQIAALLQLQP